jgi:predicted RNase H-like HicB family nuclease
LDEQDIIGFKGQNMKDYHINILYSQDDDVYIADIPDLKYCSAHGDTPEEALREVLIAKSAMLAVMTEEGTPIPEPRYRPAIYQVA